MVSEKIKSFEKKLKSNNVVRNMIASGIYKPMAMVLSYLYVRLVLSYLGIEKYGIWSTILTIVSWINYFDIGIGNGLMNRLTEAIERKEIFLCKKYVTSSYVFISSVMIVDSIILCIISSNISWNSFLRAENVAEDIKTIICLSIVILAVNFTLQICKNVLFALQKASLVGQMELTRQSLNIIGLLLLKYLSDGTILYVAILYGVSMLITNIIYTYIAYKKAGFVPSLAYFDKTIGFSLTGLGLKFFVVQICDLILFTTDNLLIAHYFGATNVTLYNTVNKAFQAVLGIHAAFITPVWAAVTKAKAGKDYRWMQSFVRKISIMIIPFCIVAIVLALFFRPISYFWLGQELDYTSLMIVLGCIYCVFTMVCNTFAVIINGLELMRQSIILSLTQAVVNIPLSIFFANVIGLETEGILLGTVFSIGMAAIIRPIIVYNYLKKQLEGSE